jgi:mannose/cellobiose epimerase-like protein (N-acyl-D-glucosamine 2-epimerase family)
MTKVDAVPPRLTEFALDTLLPLCRDRFADARNGGFHERLDAAGAPLSLGSRRLLVQCRQLYVLAQAAILGDRSGEAAAERGYAFLRAAYHDAEHGGWFFRASDAGVPVDRTKDLYGHAFVLFALAWLHRAFAAPDALALADATMDALNRHMAAPLGGFWDRADDAWHAERALRRQNPHMHLLEAMLALHEASGEPRWLDEAGKLVRLALIRFYDPDAGVLGEFFAPDWEPDPVRGHVVEPGHLFEWVWLLHRWQAASGRDDGAAAAASALFETAMRCGFDATHGGILDEIDRAGAKLTDTRRIWPVCEAIKAMLARRAAGAPVPDNQPAALKAHLFADFLDPAPGGWIETTTADGRPTTTELPGSTPYHLFMAAAECARADATGGVPA